MAWEGERLKSLIKDRGLSFTRLATLLDVSRQAVNDWIRGQVPRGTHLMQLCRILETNPSYFFSDEVSRRISLPLHRKRGVAKVTPAMRQESFELAQQYEKLFKVAPDPGLIPILRVDQKDDENAFKLANELRGRSGIEGHKPMDYQHTFNLITSLGIITIFRYFTKNIKGYAFYSKIHNHRVVFVNNNTNLLDLIFPLLHEAIHGISDGETDGYNESMENFCDRVASHVQFPREYVLSVYHAIKGRREGKKINLLKSFSSENSHAMYGIAQALNEIDPGVDINVGGADTNLKKLFPTIGDILFKDEDPRQYIGCLAMLSPIFIDIVSKQLGKATTRKIGEWLGLESSLDAKQAVEELGRTSC